MTRDRKPWAGRFREDTSPIVDAYTTSLAVDQRIALEDVRGSIAHARMLATRGIISAGDAEEMILLAGMGVGQIADLRPAGEIVREVVAEAEAILKQLAAAAS